jgi:hypothetical protein
LDFFRFFFYYKWCYKYSCTCLLMHMHINLCYSRDLKHVNFQIQNATPNTSYSISK